MPQLRPREPGGVSPVQSETKLTEPLLCLREAYRAQANAASALCDALRRFAAAAGAAEQVGGAGTEEGGRAVAGLIDEQARLFALLQERQAAVDAALAQVATAAEWPSAPLTLPELSQYARSRSWSQATVAVGEVEAATKGAADQLRSLQAVVGQTELLLQRWLTALKGTMAHTDQGRRAASAYSRPANMRRQGARFVDRRK